MSKQKTSEQLAQEHQDKFVLVQYQHGSMTHIVISPTKELNKLGTSNYGMHKRGDKFHVMLVDQHKRPDLFTVVEVEKSEETKTEEPKKTRKRTKKETE